MSPIRMEAEERKNQLLERDVERFKNRQEYIVRIKWINLKKLWLVREIIWVKIKLLRNITPILMGGFSMGGC